MDLKGHIPDEIFDSHPELRALIDASAEAIANIPEDLVGAVLLMPLFCYLRIQQLPDPYREKAMKMLEAAIAGAHTSVGIAADMIVRGATDAAADADEQASGAAVVELLKHTGITLKGDRHE